MLFLEKLKQILFSKKIKSSKHIETEISLKTIAEIPLRENKKLIELINYENEKISYKAFKRLITNIQFLCINKTADKKVMLVTSPRKEVGKSYVVANMAISFAEIGKKVLIIDANMENGRQDKIFNVPNNLGLSNYLSNIDSNGIEINEFLSKYINETAVKNINLITSGIVPPNPAELLALPKFQELIKDAKVFFDIILIDSSEIINKTEALLLTRNVNSTLIVASQKKTTLDDLEQTKRDIQNVGGNILGVILNEVKVKKEKKTKEQRKEEFSKFRLKIKEKIKKTIDKIKTKLQDTNQKLLEEAKKEEVVEIEESGEKIEEKNNQESLNKSEEVKENVESSIQENDEKKQEKNIKIPFIEKIKYFKPTEENKEVKSKDDLKETQYVEENQLSMFQETKPEDKTREEAVDKEENIINASEEKVSVKEKIVIVKDISAEKLKTFKAAIIEKSKVAKEKIMNVYFKSKDFCINKFNSLNKTNEKTPNEENNIEKITIVNDKKEVAAEENVNAKKEILNDESIKNEKMILVVVDAENGYCRVFSKDYFTEKLVRGFDKKAGYSKAHYSLKSLKRRQEYFMDKYEITESQAKKIDVLIYDTLKDYDEYLWIERKIPSDKAESYALCISKEFEMDSNETDKEFNARCQRQRKLELEDAELEIVYKLDNLWKTNKINIVDKFQLSKFAKFYEVESTMRNDSEILKNKKTKKFYDDIITGAEKRLEKANNEDKKREESEKQVIEEDRKIKQEQLRFEQQQFELEKRAAQERIKLEQENVKAEKKAEAEKIREEKRKEREIERIERKEERIRIKKEKQKQKEDAKFQKEREKVKQREEAKLEEELLVDNLYPKTKHNKNL